MRKFRNIAKANIDDGVQRDVQQFQCSRCRAVFPDFLSRCPECGHNDFSLYEEENPYTRMPLDRFIQLCGHGIWIGGTILFIALLWQTNSNNYDENAFYIYMSIISLVGSVFISALYFALSEIISRTVRLQRRLRVFHDHYRQRYPSNLKLGLKKNQTRKSKKHAKIKQNIAKKSMHVRNKLLCLNQKKASF